MRVDIEQDDTGEPIRVRIMSDTGEWTTFWPARECQETARKAAEDTYRKTLADYGLEDLIEKEWAITPNGKQIEASRELLKHGTPVSPLDGCTLKDAHDKATVCPKPAGAFCLAYIPCVDRNGTA